MNFPEAIANWQTTLTIRQPILNGGVSIAGRRAAGSLVSASEADVAHAELETRFQTVQAYWGVALARDALSAVEQGLASARAHAEVAETAHTEGTITLADLLAARVRVAELEAELIEAEHRVAGAIEGLTLVIGEDIGARLTVIRKYCSIVFDDRQVDEYLHETLAKIKTRHQGVEADA